MAERINRQGDERIYQPRIHSSLIREIYIVKEATGLPMTVLVDQAIREFLGKYETLSGKMPSQSSTQMKEIPEIAKAGVLIHLVDPQPEVRKNAEAARDWVYSEEAANLYRMAVVFKNRFLDPILLTDRHRLPDPVISFTNLRNRNTLAAYTLVRNPQGLLFEITINTEHYVDEEQDGVVKKVWSFGRWAQMETLLHEQVHLWQQNFGADPVKPGRPYHNREFVLKCESLGLHPMLGAGCHTRLADGPFALLMKELGIQPPDLTQQPTDLDLDWFKWLLDHLGKSRKGTSTLRKWTCPECGLNARFGIKGNPAIVHEPCSQKKGEKVFFVQADGLTHTIFESKDGANKNRD